MITFPFRIFGKNHFSVLGSISLLVASVILSPDQLLSAPKANATSITAQEPFSTEYQQDIETLQGLTARQDLSGLLSAINGMEEKWLTVDKQTYYSILSEACGELYSYDFGFSNISKQKAAAEKSASLM